MEHIRNSPPDVRLVSLADKLHNAGRIAADLRTHGNKVWARFSGGKSGTLWYYRELVHAYRLAGSPPEMVDELEPYWANFNASGGSEFGDYLAKRGEEVAEALLSVTDARAAASGRPTIIKAYRTVRGSAAKHVEAALPRVGELVRKYAA